MVKTLVEEMSGEKLEAIQVYCDNQSAFRLFYNPEQHQRTKHIEVRHFYVRDLQRTGVVNITYIETKK